MIQEKSASDRALRTTALVVIPSFNEAEHIESLVYALLKESGPLDLTIVVSDGGSTDRTCEIVEQIGRREKNVHLVANNKRIAGAINDAVAMYGDRAEFLIRIDAHAGYPPDYCARLVAVQQETNADSVVVTMLTRGTTCFQRAAACAQNSVLGNGGSPHRNPVDGRWVDHGHHALMRLAAFKAVGGYDEACLWNEDAELDARLRAKGCRIFLTGRVPIIYYPRKTFRTLFRQYFFYGRGRARNFLKHRERLKARQLVPLAVAPVCAALLLTPLSAVLAGPFVIWAGGTLLYGAALGVLARDACAAGSGLAAMTMHAAWSTGFIVHMLAEAFGRATAGHKQPRLQ